MCSVCDDVLAKLDVADLHNALPFASHVKYLKNCIIYD